MFGLAYTGRTGFQFNEKTNNPGTNRNKNQQKPFFPLTNTSRVCSFELTTQQRNGYKMNRKLLDALRNATTEKRRAEIRALIANDLYNNNNKKG